MPKYKIGDKTVYPCHGVGFIENIEYKNINGQELAFYIIRIIDSGLKVMVPVSNTEPAGIRDLIVYSDISQIYSLLSEELTKVDTSSWTKRFKDYNEKIKSGCIFKVTSVLRDLASLNRVKELSFGEKRMYELAIHLISQEISFVKQTDQNEIIEEINSIIKKDKNCNN